MDNNVTVLIAVKVCLFYVGREIHTHSTTAERENIIDLHKFQRCVFSQEGRIFCHRIFSELTPLWL